jgi:malonate-semialdehyde dehydrogenase (acetylating)/methylmalonate-semialdehyde dehydrogenase
MAELLVEAGLPAGVLNVVNGDKEAVDALLVDPQVQAVSFVGSTTVGEYIYRTGCDHGKRVQALCGAKNHMVVMPDADLDQAIDAVMASAYGSAGERCMAVSVMVAVGDEVADALVERLRPRLEALKVGPYTQPDAEMGPVVNPAAKARICGYIDRGVEEGAELVIDGRDISIRGFENGCFVGATVFDHVTSSMSIYTDEIFGPVLCGVRVDSYETTILKPPDGDIPAINHQFGSLLDSAINVSTDTSLCRWIHDRSHLCIRLGIRPDLECLKPRA